MARTLIAAVLGVGLLALSGAAEAQVQAAGAPSEGVDVQFRYTNPSQSRQVLEAAPPSQNGAPVNGGAEGQGGSMVIEGAPAPLVNTRITGVSDGEAPMPAEVDAEDVYTGVIPGERDTLPHIARTQRNGAEGRANTLTWIGFQPFDGRTRVFLQTGRAAEYQVVDGPDGLTVTVRLRDTTIEMSNLRRWIDASYFGRAVNRIETSRADGGVTEVTIELSRAAEYTVEGAGTYLYLDFAE